MREGADIILSKYISSLYSTRPLIWFKDGRASQIHGMDGPYVDRTAVASRFSHWEQALVRMKSKEKGRPETNPYWKLMNKKGQSSSHIKMEVSAVWILKYPWIFRENWAQILSFRWMNARHIAPNVEPEASMHRGHRWGDRSFVALRKPMMERRQFMGSSRRDIQGFAWTKRRLYPAAVLWNGNRRMP